MKLHHKLTLSITILVLCAALGIALLSSWSSDRYHQELTQQLHRSLARYVLDHQPVPLLGPDGVNHKGLKALAMNVMMINPLVEVYLLDADGNILGHALPESSVDNGQIDLNPIQRFLATANSEAMPLVLGTNPRNTASPAVFSVAPITEGDQRIGYLYIVLASKQAHSILEQVTNSHTLRLSLAGTAALFIFLALGNQLIFSRVSQPVRTLNAEIREYRRNLPGDAVQEALEHPTCHLDEVSELRAVFQHMKQRIQEQFDQIAQADRLRRELVSNVSHDLRTPLSTLQGYLETLLLKRDTLNETDRLTYTEIAFRHSQSLGKLVSQLFELSKLDAGKVKPHLEPFSLKELVFDLKQDYELQMAARRIELNVDCDASDLWVQGDIELIQRVLQNLIDNALRYTPRGGTIRLSLSTKAPCSGRKHDTEKVCITISDTGPGISPADLPYVFDRYFQSNEPLQSGHGNQTESRRTCPDERFSSGGSGLGLSIVKRILDLHQAPIEVMSQPGQGASFRFFLVRHEEKQLLANPA